MTEIQIIRVREVMRMTGLARSTIYRWIADGRFPAPVRLGSHSVGWRMAEVEHWLKELKGPADVAMDAKIEAML